MPTKSSAELQHWAVVGRSTIVGTLACMALSLLVVSVIFGGQSPVVMQRAVFCAIVMPLVLAAPLLIYTGAQLRDMALTNLRLSAIARTDSLTLCLNRGAFTHRVDNALRDQKSWMGGALLMIDADNFKGINDAYGHDAGDVALRTIARSIRTVVRSSDLVGRMGGEEFGVFLPGVDQRHAARIAERIRRSVNLASFTPTTKPHQLSVSVGGVVFDDRAKFSELFRIADQCLYSAKETGRNRVAVVHEGDYRVAEQLQPA